MLKARWVLVVMLFAVSLLMAPTLAQADWTGHWIVYQDTFDTAATYIDGNPPWNINDSAGDNMDGWMSTYTIGSGFGWSGMGNPVSGGGSGPGALGTHRAAYVNKVFDVVPGAIYNLSFAVAVEHYGGGVNWLCPPATGTSLWFRYNWGVGNFVNAKQVPISFRPCPADVFKTVSTTFTVPDGVTQVEVYIWPGLHYLGAEGWSFWDDITFDLTYYPGDASDVPLEVRLQALEAAVAAGGGLTQAQVLSLIDGSIDNNSATTIGADVAGMISTATAGLATTTYVNAQDKSIYNTLGDAHNKHVHNKGSSSRDTSGPSISVTLIP